MTTNIEQEVRLPAFGVTLVGDLARPAAARLAAPLKITSCIDSPRSSAALLSPSTHRTASITLDLPHPLGPTTPTRRPGTSIWVGSTNDLNPANLICRSCTLRFSGKPLCGSPRIGTDHCARVTTDSSRLTPIIISNHFG